MIVIVMGVSGSGKSTVGARLGEELGWEFCDADDFHTQANRNKMANGIPLTDDDRAMWLESLRELIEERIRAKRSMVLACSALKEWYRGILTIDGQVRFVYLKGTFAEIEARLKNRAGHFMPVQLLTSQFESLEEPENALTVGITHPLEEIIQLIRKGLSL